MRRREEEAFDVGNATHAPAVDVAKRLDFSATPSKSIFNDDDSFSRSAFSPISFSSRQYAPPPPPPPTNVPMTPLSTNRSLFRSFSPPSVFDDDKLFAKPSIGGEDTCATPRKTCLVDTPLSSFMSMSLVDKNASLLSPYRENSKADLMLPYNTSSKPYNDHFISYSVAGILKPPEEEEKRPSAPASPIKPTTTAPARMSFAQEEQLRDESQVNESVVLEEDKGGIWSEKKRDIWGPNRGEDISFTSLSSAEQSLGGETNETTASQPPRSRFGSKLANEAYLKLKKRRAMSAASQDGRFSLTTSRGGAEDDSDLMSSSLPSRRSFSTTSRRRQQQEYYSRRGSTQRPSSKLRYERTRENYEDDDEEEDDFYGDLYNNARHGQSKMAFPRGSNTRKSSYSEEEEEDEAKLRLLRRRNRGEFEPSDEEEDEYLDEDAMAWSQRLKRFPSVDDDDLLLGIHRRRFQGDDEEEDELLRVQRVRPKKQSVGFDLDRFRYAPKSRKETQVTSAAATTTTTTKSPTKLAVEKDDDDDDYLLGLARNVMDRPMHTLEAMMQAISSRLPAAAPILYHSGQLYT